MTHSELSARVALEAAPAGSPGVSSQTPAAGTSPSVPAVFSKSWARHWTVYDTLPPSRALMAGEYPPPEEIRALVLAGLSDKLLAAHYGHARVWARRLRATYGIPPTYTLRGPKPRSHGRGPGVERAQPFLAPPEPATNYTYESYTDEEIEALEMRPRRRVQIDITRGNITAELLGDPAPGRAAC